MEKLLFIETHFAPRAGKTKMYLALIDYVSDTFNGLLMVDSQLEDLKSTIERRQEELSAANKRWNKVNVSYSKYNETQDGFCFYNLYIEGELVATFRPVKGKFIKGAVENLNWVA